MDERGFETLLERILRQDFSAGTEKFRDELLARCLAELDGGLSGAELDEDELELLAAAGDPDGAAAFLGDNRGSHSGGNAPLNLP